MVGERTPDFDAAGYTTTYYSTTGAASPTLPVSVGSGHALRVAKTRASTPPPLGRRTGAHWEDGNGVEPIGAEEAEHRDTLSGEGESTFHLIMTIVEVGLVVLLFWMQVGINPVDWVNAIVERVPRALVTLPTGIAPWALTTVLMSLCFQAIVGYGSIKEADGSVTWSPKWPCAASDFKYFGVTTFVAFLEELWFRAALLPPRATGVQAILAWAIYGAYHVDLVHFHFTCGGGKFARNPTFLLLTDALGLSCTAIFLGTGGSFLASFLLHNTCVQAAMFLFGGISKLKDEHED